MDFDQLLEKIEESLNRERARSVLKESIKKVAESLLDIKEEIQEAGSVKSIALASGTLEEAAELLLKVVIL